MSYGILIFEQFSEELWGYGQVEESISIVLP